MAQWYLLSGPSGSAAPQRVKILAESPEEAVRKGWAQGFDHHSCVLDERTGARLRRIGMSVAFLFEEAPVIGRHR
ncbi:MAG: hypothetical protein U5L11_01165 [Arhodomonas sp.]|nr:hypothetical protein [Arhodomonas sp.]